MHDTIVTKQTGLDSQLTHAHLCMYLPQPATYYIAQYINSLVCGACVQFMIFSPLQSAFGSGAKISGRKNLREFVYDHSYWSVDPRDDHYTNQEMVRNGQLCGGHFLPWQHVDVWFVVCFVYVYTLRWTSSVLMIRQDCSNTGIICTCRCSKIWGFQCCSLLLMGTILVFLLMAKLGPAKPIQ